MRQRGPITPMQTDRAYAEELRRERAGENTREYVRRDLEHTDMLALRCILDGRAESATEEDIEHARAEWLRITGESWEECRWQEEEFYAQYEEAEA